MLNPTSSARLPVKLSCEAIAPSCRTVRGRLRTISDATLQRAVAYQSEGCLFGARGIGIRNRRGQSHACVPRDSNYISVDGVKYMQESISPKFRDGTSLAALIDDLGAAKVNPLAPKDRFPWLRCVRLVPCSSGHSNWTW